MPEETPEGAHKETPPSFPSIRIPVFAFRPSTSQRKVLRRNSDTIVETFNCFAGCPDYPAHKDVMTKWALMRHGYPNLAEDYGFEFDTIDLFMAVKHKGTGKPLGGVFYVPQEDTMYGTMFYFDPDEKRRSLGTYIICN